MSSFEIRWRDLLAKMLLFYLVLERCFATAKDNAKNFLTMFIRNLAKKPLGSMFAYVQRRLA